MHVAGVTFKTDRIQICQKGQVLLVFCGLNRRKVLISLIENITRQLSDLICLICPFKVTLEFQSRPRNRVKISRYYYFRRFRRFLK